MAERSMKWSEHLRMDPGILGGKLVITGTRLSAEFILGLFAAGWRHEQVLESYPALTPEALRAVFAYAAELAQNEIVHAVYANNASS